MNTNSNNINLVVQTIANEIYNICPTNPAELSASEDYINNIIDRLKTLENIINELEIDEIVVNYNWFTKMFKNIIDCTLIEMISTIIEYVIK